ncbi:type III-B CRISPR module RAMP protein Cmr6 [Thermobifida cellulosilytica]|uniref:type III-B CRISPR module RAMP protein Cmr6 n=1 Tax=Thermobifida cellulosilytica TaxID=144786 RepID=UPI000A6C154F|nr:type III-B CRISPR module RAMP protein Cmr6 [Thermobifida cellulosilytica]
MTEQPSPRPSPAHLARIRRPSPQQTQRSAQPSPAAERRQTPSSTRKPSARRSETELRAAGPLGRLVRVRRQTDPARPPRLEGAGKDANALILLRRTAFPDFSADEVELSDEAVTALTTWAAESGLGQRPEDVKAVTARRKLALDRLRAQGLTVRRVTLRPEWRLAIGLGNKDNAHEIGITLHGSYGWPVIPGSTLKGVTAQWVWDHIRPTTPEEIARYVRVFGAPLPEERAAGVAEQPETARGRVRFLDAFASGVPVTVTVDVLTPHVKPYYDRTADEQTAAQAPPPAEHHQPVPVRFLTVSAGRFDAALVGDTPDETEQAARWLVEAVNELGVGAKTSAGYGYLAGEEKA